MVGWGPRPPVPPPCILMGRGDQSNKSLIQGMSSLLLDLFSYSLSLVPSLDLTKGMVCGRGWPGGPARVINTKGGDSIQWYVLACFPLSSVTSLGCRGGRKCLGKMTMARKSVYSVSERISRKLS